MPLGYGRRPLNDIELKRLRYFERIAADGSLTKAAGVLRIAQPALSRQMRLLEAEVGATLFSRTARGMRLTEEGEYLLAAIGGPLRELELAVRTVQSASDRIVGDFTIGMTSGIGDLLSVDLATRMRAQFLDIHLRLVEGATGSLIDWLVRGIIDFALIETRADDERIENRNVLQEELVLIGSKAGDAGNDTPIAFADVLRLPLILPSHHLGIRNVINTAAAARRAKLSPIIEIDAPRHTIELVRRRLGYAIVSPTIVRREDRDELMIRPIVAPTLFSGLYLSSRRQRRVVARRAEEPLIDCIVLLIDEHARHWTLSKGRQ